jgi:hypothetical protein
VVFGPSHTAQSVQCLTTDWTTWVRSPADAKDISSSLCVQTSSEAHSASYPLGTVGKALPGRDADLSPPSTAEVMNEYELYPLPLVAYMTVAGRLYFHIQMTITRC